MTLPPLKSSTARTDVTIGRLVAALSHYRRLALGIAMACALAGMAYVLLARPVYQADMMIQLDDAATSSSTWSLLGDAASLFDMKSSPAAETQIIGSRLVVERAVDKLRLHIGIEPAASGWLSRWRAAPGPVPEVLRFDVPAGLEGEPFVLTMESEGWRLEGPGLDVPMRVRAGIEQVLSTAVGDFRVQVAACACQPDARFELVRHSWRKTVADVRGRLVVQEKARQSGVLIVTLAGHDPERLRALVREIGDQYVRQNVERKSAEAAQSLVFLERQLPSLKQELEAAQDRYTSMTARHGVVDLNEEARLALKAASDAGTQRLWLTQKRQELVTRFTEAHPGVMAIDRQLDVVRQKQQDMEKVMRGLPALQRQTAQLALDVRIATERYTSLLSSAQQLALMKAGRVASARVVDPAEVAEDPVAPNRLMVLVAAMLAGIVAGAGAAFAADWMASAVSEPDEIEHVLGVPVLGVVPRSARQAELDAARQRPDERLLCGVAKSDPAIESLRSLLTALQLSSLSRERNVLLVTGSEPAAGKTFVSANLAAVLAAAGQKVLLIDGDMRRGTVHWMFGRDAAPGLSEVLAHAADWQQVVQRELASGLDLISCGDPQPHVGDMLARADLDTLLGEARQRYDVVLIDTPPALAAADAARLARHADLVLLVARAGHSRLADLTAACKQLRQCGAAVGGVVLNDLVPRLGCYGYPYAGYGGYGADMPGRTRPRGFSFRRRRDGGVA